MPVARPRSVHRSVDGPRTAGQLGSNRREPSRSGSDDAGAQSSTEKSTTRSTGRLRASTVIRIGSMRASAVASTFAWVVEASHAATHAGMTAAAAANELILRIRVLLAWRVFATRRFDRGGTVLRARRAGLAGAEA